MFSKLFIIVTTVIATIRACDNAGALSTNPMTAPSASNWPTIGEPFTVEWSIDYPNLSPEVTLSLYKITGDCPGNACVELADIAGFYTNNGSFTWTPSNSLAASDNYAILFINENPCLTVWGAAFGLHPAGYTGGSSAASVAAPAAALVTNEAAASGAVASGAVSSGAVPVTSAAAETAAPVSAANAEAPITTTRYTTVYTTETMYAGATSAAAAEDPSVTTVIVTDTTTVFEMITASGFSLGPASTAS